MKKVFSATLAVLFISASIAFAGGDEKGKEKTKKKDKTEQSSQKSDKKSCGSKSEGAKKGCCASKGASKAL